MKNHSRLKRRDSWEIVKSTTTLSGASEVSVSRNKYNVEAFVRLSRVFEDYNV